MIILGGRSEVGVFIRIFSPKKIYPKTKIPPKKQSPYLTFSQKKHPFKNSLKKNTGATVQDIMGVGWAASVFEVSPFGKKRVNETLQERLVREAKEKKMAKLQQKQKAAELGELRKEEAR